MYLVYSCLAPASQLAGLFTHGPEIARSIHEWHGPFVKRWFVMTGPEHSYILSAYIILEYAVELVFTLFFLFIVTEPRIYHLE